MSVTWRYENPWKRRARVGIFALTADVGGFWSVDVPAKRDSGGIRIARKETPTTEDNNLKAAKRAAIAALRTLCADALTQTKEHEHG